MTPRDCTGKVNSITHDKSLVKLNTNYNITIYRFAIYDDIILSELKTQSE